MKNSFIFLTVDIGRLMRKRFDMLSRGYGATGAQWRVLGALNRNPGMTQVALANWLEVEAITAGRMIDRLEKSGLVERRADPADRRAWRLYLTDAAAPVLEQLQTCADGVMAEALAGVDDAAHAQMIATLTRVRCNLLEGVLPDSPLSDAQIPETTLSEANRNHG